MSVDEAVHMPSGGGEKRAEAIAMLAGMYHELATAPQVADWIGAAGDEALDEIQHAALREFQRVYTNMTCLSADFVRKQVGARVRSEQLWRELRPAGDWSGFVPAFEGVATTAREEARLRSVALQLNPYDAMMEQYDPGNRAADITPVFAELKTFLKDFVPQAIARQAEKLARRLRLFPKLCLGGDDRRAAMGSAATGAAKCPKGHAQRPLRRPQRLAP